ncbi:MAG: transcription antitermination protein NusB [Bacteroidales bacterium]|nr:transcription antitermination protein NusB [Bacteroidales bacterium]
MLNRRLLRIKAFKVLYANEASESQSLDAACKTLLTSCEWTRNLYYFLLGVCPHLVQIAQDKIDSGKSKLRPTPEEASPNMKFVENEFVKLLVQDDKILNYCQKHGLGWADNDIFLRKLFNSIISSDYYAEYMSSPKKSLKEDCKLFKRIFEEEFEDNQMLEDILEEMSVFWIDDLEYTLNVVLRSIDSVSAGNGFNHPDVFLKEDDRDFALRLLTACIQNYDEYAAIIAEKLVNWEPDRLVSTDCVLVIMGLAEAVAFPSIPVKVTINEYVEISKYYSTPKSRTFVNGLLDTIIQEKSASGQIVKSGRGLFTE